MIKTRFSGMYLSFLKIIEDHPHISVSSISKILNREELTEGADNKIVKDLLRGGHILLDKSRQCFITPNGQSHLANVLSDNEYLKAHVRTLPGNCQACGKHDYQLTYFRKEFICANCLNQDDVDSESCANPSWRASSPISAFPSDF